MAPHPQPPESAGPQRDVPEAPPGALAHERATHPSTFIYDGACGFCRMWATRWQRRIGNRIEFRSYQSAADDFPQVPRARFAQAAQLIESDGTVYEGAAAIFRVLRDQPGRRWMWWVYSTVPLVGAFCNVVYRLVARHRPLMSRLTRWLWGDVSQESSYSASRSIFLRLLGAVYLIAFLSFGSQILGLNGEHGVLPLRRVMEWHEQRLDAVSWTERLARVPTFCWFDDSDASLTWQCRGGTILSVLLILGIAPVPILIALWALYLSLSISQNIFLSFQWDTLLLEAGFVAVFCAPMCLVMRARRDAPPSRIALWMVRLLLFKLMFLSGVVKLTSGDSTWRDFSALTFHYETQPLPAWTSWYAHKLPLAVHEVALLVAFAIELVIPFVIFLPRNMRHVAGFAIVFLMLMIGLTGNYNFFNLLVVVLCIPLFDDRFWRSLIPRRFNRARVPLIPPLRTHRWRATCFAVIAVGYCYASTVQGTRGSWPRGAGAPPLPAFATSETAIRVLRSIAPFRTINAYGLFRSMTTQRPEIIIEGSRDGKEWQAYEFPWKPGDVNRRPAFVEPYQPRLDWQMWFAALGRYRYNRWVGSLMTRLLEGSPDVLALFSRNPFPDEPPRFVRAVLYHYHFSDAATRRATGAWWTRERVGLYAPILRR